MAAAEEEIDMSWKTNPDIIVMHLEGLISPEFNLALIKNVAGLIDERLYIIGIK
jgi:hypothetical protein